MPSGLLQIPVLGWFSSINKVVFLNQGEFTFWILEIPTCNFDILALTLLRLFLKKKQVTAIGILQN